MSKVIAKKSLSQNFLNNENIKAKITNLIINDIDYIKYDIILEIGPGNGELTEFLIKSNKEIIALEIDKRLPEKIMLDLNHPKNLTIFNIDAFLEIQKPTVLLKYQPFCLVSNLPFKIGSRILVDLALNFSNVDFFVILQKEVVQKTLFNEKITFFGCWINLFWEIEKLIDISPGNFTPKPKVYSTLIKGKSKNIKTTKEEKIKMLKMLKILFSSPKKTIFNNLYTNLVKINKIIDKTQLVEILKKCDILEKTRLNKENYQIILQKLVKNLQDF